MKFEQTYTNDGLGQINILSGPVTDTEFLSAYEARFSDLDKFKNLKYIISDMSEVTSFELSNEAVKKASDIANKHAKYNNNLYVAGIHTKDIVYGLARVWRAYSDDDETGWITNSFRTRNDALLWLKSIFSDIEFSV